MEGEFKVRAVDFEEKSLVELETELVEQHEREVAEQNQDTVVENTTESEQPVNEAAYNIDDEVVVNHIRSKYGRDVSSIDELLQERVVQEELDADVAAFNKYKKETGRGLDDFLKLNRNFDDEDPNRVLSDFYRESGYDDEDIEYKMSMFSYDEDLDSDQEIKQKKLERKQELKKAIKYFSDLKEQYKVPLESRESFVPQEERESYESYQAYKQAESAQLEEQQKKSMYFQQKTEELFSKFEGFGFNIDENTKLVYKPGDADEIKNRQSNLNNFITKFLDENGYINDTEGFHKAIAMAMDPDKTARFFYEKGKADAVTDFEKESKNINMVRKSPAATPKEGLQIRVVEEGYDGKLRIKKR
jgi:hypothetical protein